MIKLLRPGFIATIALLSTSPVLLANAGPTVIRGASDYDNLCKTAGANKRNVAILATDQNSSGRYGQELEHTVRRSFSNSYVLGTLNQNMAPGVEVMLRITKHPTLIVIDPEGKEIDRLVGAYNNEDLVSLLRAGTRGKSALEPLREAAASENADARSLLMLANAYKKRDRQEEAIATYNRILESNANGAGTQGRINYSVIQQLSDLGKTTPRALEVLKNNRAKIDANAAIVKNKTDSLSLLFAYNSALGEPEKNVSLFLRIPESSVAKQRLFPQVFTQLVGARNYDAITALVDVEAYVNSTYPRFLFEPGHSAHDGHDHSRQERAIKRRVEEMTKSGVEACLGKGRLEKAKRLAAQALDYTQNKAFATDLIKAANRAGNAALAKEFSSWLATYEKTMTAQPGK